MSKKLALSSALSVLLMASFALFGSRVAEPDGLSGVGVLLPSSVGMPQAPTLADLPILR